MLLLYVYKLGILWYNIALHAQWRHICLTPCRDWINKNSNHIIRLQESGKHVHEYRDTYTKYNWRAPQWQFQNLTPILYTAKNFKKTKSRVSRSQMRLNCRHIQLCYIVWSHCGRQNNNVVFPVPIPPPPRPTECINLLYIINYIRYCAIRRYVWRT